MSEELKDEVEELQADPELETLEEEDTRLAQQQNAEPEPEPAAPKEGLSKEDIRELVQAVRQQPQQPAAQLSDEEIRKQLNIFQPSEQLLADLQEGGEKALAAVQTIVDGATRQAVSLARLDYVQQIQQLAQTVQPALAIAKQQQDEQLKAGFFKEYPDLKPYESLLTEIRDAMVSRGEKFASPKEAYKAVATRAQAFLQQAGLKGSAKSQQPGSNGRQMSTLTSGGQGGAGQASMSKKSEVEDLFG